MASGGVASACCLTRADQIAFDERLGDLHRVGGRTLAQVVADHPQAERAGMRVIVADPAHEHLVAALARSGVGTSSTITPGARPSSSRAWAAGSGSRVWTLTATECPTLTGTRTQVTDDPDRLVLEDLARLEHHLALLVGVIVALGERPRGTDHVEGDRFRIHLGRRASAMP